MKKRQPRKSRRAQRGNEDESEQYDLTFVLVRSVVKHKMNTITEITKCMKKKRGRINQLSNPTLVSVRSVRSVV